MNSEIYRLNNILVLMFAVFSLNAYSQNANNENLNDAEKLFSYYMPLTFSVKYQNVLWENSGMNSLITHRSESVWTPSFGIEYNFLQRNRFNFKAGFFIRNMERETLTRYNSDYFPPQGTSFSLLESPYWTFHIPITLEYIYYFAKYTALAFNFGYELQIYETTLGIDTYNKGGLSKEGIPVVEIIATEREHPRKMTSGINFGVGLYVRTDPGLIKVEVNYHLHFKSLITEEVHIIDNISDINSYSSNIWTGHYYGVSVYFTPFHKKTSN